MHSNALSRASTHRAKEYNFGLSCLKILKHYCSSLMLGWVALFLTASFCWCIVNSGIWHKNEKKVAKVTKKWHFSESKMRPVHSWCRTVQSACPCNELSSLLGTPAGPPWSDAHWHPMPDHRLLQTACRGDIRIMLLYSTSKTDWQDIDS